MSTNINSYKRKRVNSQQLKKKCFQKLIHSSNSFLGFFSFVNIYFFPFAFQGAPILGFQIIDSLFPFSAIPP
ncbi:hypothetical protein ERO13_D13G196050v2 [Gossypium hirsutum]|uniref:Uncharacterized protein n=4 Tax=Gossypium TaxID=3633 RepID=A0A0D2U5E9_GOSRA|nr:hypothetical protein ES319_D13G223600v1 [Gossypium barbadense]KAG4112994.1 hypothetical protein ERO13_D13G196050v2 [Gossypium hirsutum]KJB82958.1 hypothetical protein B456_013G222200 [Gossypium raimondii]TYH36059.1 hypothetical protein ES332_D13G238100v1 [Gossypium tomentosum]TYI48183.1 hypothetical protein E1A91_D13G228300v1 [Gossypium mustelinum]